MFSIKHAILAPAVILAGLAGPLAAQGGPGCGGPGMMRGAGGPGACMGAAAIPGLTADQQTRLDAIRARHDAAFKAKHESALEARQEMHKLMADPATTDATLQAAQQKASSAHLAVMLERRAMAKECLEVLTPEQRTALKDRGMGMGMGMGHGPRHHRGMGPGCGMGPGAGMGPGWGE